jgi:putative aldouronate transport system substrate-binding protein
MEWKMLSTASKPQIIPFIRCFCLLMALAILGRCASATNTPKTPTLTPISKTITPKPATFTPQHTTTITDTSVPIAVATDTPTQPVAADPYGAYGTAVTMTTVRKYETTEKLPAGDTPENNQYTRYVKTTLNIDTKYIWSAASADYDAKINLAIAGNDLPDAMVVNLAQFTQLVDNDQLADLTDTYNQYASPVIKQMADSSKGLGLKAVTFNGKIMGIPALTVPDDGYQLMWIRKDWLDKLNLAVPKTMDDIEKVAQAFVKQDPGGNGAGKTIGITGPANGSALYADFLNPTNGDFTFDPVFFSYHAYPGFWVKGSDGKAVYGSILPETKTALARLADLYKKGLIDPQMGVRTDYTEPIKSGQAGIYFGEWWNGYWPLPDVVKNNPKANWQAYAVPLDDKGMWNPHQGILATSFMVVRKGYAHPEAAMKIVNLFNRDESKMDLTVGSLDDEVLRLPQAMYDEGEVTYKAMMDVLTGKAKAADFADPKYAAYKLLKDDVAKIGTAKLAPFDNMDIQYWDTKSSVWSRSYSILVGGGAIYNPIGGKANVNVVYSLTYAPTPLITSKWSNLQTMESAAFLKIILGTAPIDSFDQFVTDWKAQGGDAVTAEIQASIK